MRSGSTWLVNGIQSLGLTKGFVHVGHPKYVNEDSRIDPTAAAVLFHNPNYVYHNHIRCIGTTEPTLYDYKDQVVVVVTYRNIYDTVVSWKESLDIDIERGKGLQSSHSSIVAPIWWYEFTDGEKYRWVAQNVVPWLTSFYLSWSDYQGPVYFVDYDNLAIDPVGILSDTLSYSGRMGYYSHKDLAYAMQPKDKNLNVGEPGRGMKILPRSVLDQIDEHLASWGDARVERLAS